VHHGVVREFFDEPPDRIGVGAETLGRESGGRRRIRESTPAAAKREVVGRQRRGECELGGDFFGSEQVIGVEELQPVAAGRTQAGVAGGGRSGVGLVDDRDARRVGKCFRDGERGVGGAVVDEDDFAMRPGLGERGAEGLGEPRRGVVGRDDDGDERTDGGRS